jgi:hypothetical protein
MDAVLEPGVHGFVWRWCLWVIPYSLMHVTNPVHGVLEPMNKGFPVCVIEQRSFDFFSDRVVKLKKD